MTLSLKAEVLDKLAKEWSPKSLNWFDFKAAYYAVHGSDKKPKQIERVVELALAAKQAEVEKEIPELLFDFSRNVLCEPRSSTRLCNDIEEFLRKRLLAKSEEANE